MFGFDFEVLIFIFDVRRHWNIHKLWSFTYLEIFSHLFVKYASKFQFKRSNPTSQHSNLMHELQLLQTKSYQL